VGHVTEQSAQQGKEHGVQQDSADIVITRNRIGVITVVAAAERDEAWAVFDDGFEVADLREGAESIGRLWAKLTDEPLPARYDFRMRPGTS